MRLLYTCVRWDVIDVDGLSRGVLLSRKVRQRSADSIHLQLVVSDSFKQLDAVARWSIQHHYCTVICRRRQRLVQTRLNIAIHISRYCRHEQIAYN